MSVALCTLHPLAALTMISKSQFLVVRLLTLTVWFVSNPERLGSLDEE